MGYWCDQAGVPHDRLVLVNLRERRNPLNFEEDREILAAGLSDHDVETLIVDPFANASRGVESINNSEVSQWLGELQEFARLQVGVIDLVLTAHAGWLNTGRSHPHPHRDVHPEPALRLLGEPADLTGDL